MSVSIWNSEAEYRFLNASLFSRAFRLSSGMMRRRWSIGLRSSRRDSGRLLKACICRVTMACFSGERLLNVLHIWLRRARSAAGNLSKRSRRWRRLACCWGGSFSRTCSRFSGGMAIRRSTGLPGLANFGAPPALGASGDLAAGDFGAAPGRTSLRGGGGGLAGLGPAVWAHIPTAAISSAIPTAWQRRFIRLELRVRAIRTDVPAELVQIGRANV